MKKLINVFATIIGLMSFSWDASLAQVKQAPAFKVEQKIEQKIIIVEPSIQKIVSAENDKSQPTDSLIQRYRVVYETTKGQKETMIIQIETNDKGQILKTSVVSAPKAASPSFQAKCPAERPFLHCTVILDMRTGAKYYICWCSASR